MYESITLGLENTDTSNVTILVGFKGLFCEKEVFVTIRIKPANRKNPKYLLFVFIDFFFNYKIKII